MKNEIGGSDLINYSVGFKERCKSSVSPISIEIEDGTCYLKIKGETVGFVRRLEFKADVNGITKLEIERVSYSPTDTFAEDLRDVKDHVGFIRLIQEYYPSPGQGIVTTKV